MDGGVLVMGGSGDYFDVADCGHRRLGSRGMMKGVSRLYAR